MILNRLSLPAALCRLSLLALALALPAVHAETTVAKPRPKAKSAKSSSKSKAKPGMKKVAATNVNGEYANFASWKEGRSFIDMMVEKHGFDRTELEALLNKTRLVDSAIQLMKPAPPGKPKNWTAYRARFVEPMRIAAGVAFWKANADALARAEARFGVPADIIVGIIGVETIYGRHTGNFRVLDAIATLAFSYPDTPNREMRVALFRSELENTLLYARENGIDPFSLNGSYAGAIGLPQFMPSSLRKYAVDFDGDQHVDLRSSSTDAIGSVANFLVEHGWKRGEPYVFPASVSATNAEGKAPWDKYIGQGLKAQFTIDDMRRDGVTPAGELPANMLFSLVDLQNGAEPTEYWLGAHNFFVITQYNRSYFYAMSVIDLGRAIKTARFGAEPRTVP